MPPPRAPVDPRRRASPMGGCGARMDRAERHPNRSYTAHEPCVVGFRPGSVPSATERTAGAACPNPREAQSVVPPTSWRAGESASCEPKPSDQEAPATAATGTGPWVASGPEPSSGRFCVMHCHLVILDDSPGAAARTPAAPVPQPPETGTFRTDATARRNTRPAEASGAVHRVCAPMFRRTVTAVASRVV